MCVCLSVLTRSLALSRNLYLRYQRARVEAVDDPRVRFEISTIGGIEVSLLPFAVESHCHKRRVCF